MTTQYKNVTPAEKLNQSIKLYYAARELKKASLKTLYPHLTKQAIENKIRKIFQDAGN